MARNITVVTGNRAEYGLLLPIIKRIKTHPDLNLSVLQVPANNFVGSYMKTREFILNTNQISFVLCPCDREEILASVIAFFYANIPIAHFMGGAIDSGTHDNATRYAISLFSHIVFCESEEAKARLVKLGIEDWRVIVSGSTAFDDLVLDESVVPKYDYDLFMMHPATIDLELTKKEIKEALSLIDKPTFVIYPNSDVGCEIIIEAIKKHEFPLHSLIVKEGFPRPQFLALLKNCKRFISNSSAIAYEAPFFGVEVLNLSIRNAEREKPPLKTGASDIIVNTLFNLEINDRLMRKRIAY